MPPSNPTYKIRRTLMHRTRVEPTEGCWEWKGGVEATGYGLMPSTRRRVHVVAWEEFRGPVPPGHSIEQVCENRRCWRPEHLMAVEVE